MAVAVGIIAESVDAAEILLGEYFRAESVLRAAAFRDGAAGVVFARQDAVLEREIWQESESLAVAFREHAFLRFSMQHAVVILNAAESGRAGGDSGFGFLQLLDCKIGAADFADFAGLNQFVERAQRVGDWRFRIGTMELIEIDIIG